MPAAFSGVIYLMRAESVKYVQKVVLGIAKGLARLVTRSEPVFASLCLDRRRFRSHNALALTSQPTDTRITWATRPRSLLRSALVGLWHGTGAPESPR